MAVVALDPSIDRKLAKKVVLVGTVEMKRSSSTGPLAPSYSDPDSLAHATSESNAQLAESLILSLPLSLSLVVSCPSLFPPKARPHRQNENRGHVPILLLLSQL